MRRGLLGVTLSLILVLLAGCSLAGEDELYALPKLSSDYYQLQEKLELILAQGAEYSAPGSGQNVQPVQLHDLNGDGVAEAVAFFRVANDERPLKIYIFQQMEDASYEVMALIEGDGNAINSISYEDVVEGPYQELIVSWQLVNASASRLLNLSVHTLGGEGATEIMRTAYSSYQALDIDRDGLMEIVAIQYDAAGEKSRAELFSAEQNVLQLSASAPLTVGVSSIGTVRMGRLREYQSAVFVHSLMGDGNYVTDIFAWQNNEFQNIVMDQETGISLSTVVPVETLQMTDINGDGMMEIPFPYEMPKVNRPGAAEPTYWALAWRQFDADGHQYATISTYHNRIDQTEGWYFELPDSWRDQVHIGREDDQINMRTVTLSRYRGEGLEPEPFLRIYRLTGTNRQSRATMGNRFKLLELGSCVYAAELLDSSWDHGLDQETVIASFHMIREEWS